MVEALQDAAEVVAASPHVRWWDAPVASDALDDQWTVSWSDQPGSPATGISVCPAQHRGSNEWWSFPSARPGSAGDTDVKLLSSTRRMSDGSRCVPVGLVLVEDVFRDEAWVRKLHVPEPTERHDPTVPADTAKIPQSPEITGPDDWADLCRRFPLYVTAAVEREWAETTGLHSPGQRWVMPDWAAISRHYDGVHLTVACHLAAATRAMALDDRTASVIAGWDPDRTYWFAPVTEDATATRWARDDERRWRSTAS